MAFGHLMGPLGPPDWWPLANRAILAQKAPGSLMKIWHDLADILSINKFVNMFVCLFFMFLKDLGIPTGRFCDSFFKI